MTYAMLAELLAGYTYNIREHSTLAVLSDQERTQRRLAQKRMSYAKHKTAQYHRQKVKRFNQSMGE